MKIIQSNKKKVNVKFNKKSNDIKISDKKIIVGIKSIKKPSEWRELGFKLIQQMISNKFKNPVIPVPLNSKEFIEGLYLGAYKFDKYKSNPSKDIIKKVVLSNNKDDLTFVIDKAKTITSAQCLTRNWVNTSPEDANSSSISDAVIKSFKDSKNVSVKIYNEKKLKKLNMRGHLAVNRASRHEAKTIKLTYTPSKKPKKTILLVGKGLTYDSGGLSIKPGNHMVTMKADKAGAMTIWGIIKALETLGSDYKVVAYMALAENMIDGSAYKPDDVITMKNGKTVHIKNTDAEGRVVLFDNITLAEEENKGFDELYTFATLTGAAVFQFGNEATGMVGFNDKMKKHIKKVGLKEGEIFMNAEFHKYMLNGVDDDLADLTNTGTPGMGCQKAGLFLTNSLKKKNVKKYLHLDIAGPAFIEAPFGTNQKGGTGFGVRTFVNFLSKK